jgi:hypothetical protein
MGDCVKQNADDGNEKLLRPFVSKCYYNNKAHPLISLKILFPSKDYVILAQELLFF